MGTMRRDKAESIYEDFRACGVPIDSDFHRLRQSDVESVLNVADRYGYRAPRNANGSRGRCFYEAVRRALARDE